MKTQRRIIRCLLFTCAGNEYGLTDASLKTAKEITVASSLTIVSKPQRKQRMKRRGGGEKKKKKKKKEKNPVSWLKNDIFPIGEKTVLPTLFIVYRGQVTVQSFVRSLRTSHDLRRLYPSQAQETRSMYHSNS